MNSKCYLEKVCVSDFASNLLTSCLFCFGFQSHTILLVQPTKRPEGRTYADYESVNECMEGGCRYGSQKLLLKPRFLHIPKVT